MFCRNCRKELSDKAEICVQCGSKPFVGQKYCQHCGAETALDIEICLNCGVRVKPKMYAGFWRRVFAIILDNIIVGLLVFFTGFLIIKLNIRLHRENIEGIFQGHTKLFSYFLSIMVAWLYCALFESSVEQATFGKMILGIKVTDLDGNRISFWRATGRYFGKMISALTLGIGLIMVGFTR
jgi:uncharacterized RDD family membrane protein YckC